MSRHSDRYLDNEEWERFKADLDAGMPAEDLRDRYQLSKRNLYRSVKRACRQENWEVPTEVETNFAEPPRKRRSAKPEDVERYLTPTQKIVASPEWEFMTPIEKIQRLLPGQVSESRARDYLFEGRVISFRDLLVKANAKLIAEGLPVIHGPGFPTERSVT